MIEARPEAAVSAGEHKEKEVDKVKNESCLPNSSPIVSLLGGIP